MQRTLQFFFPFLHFLILQRNVRNVLYCTTYVHVHVPQFLPSACVFDALIVRTHHQLHLYFFIDAVMLDWCISCLTLDI